MHKSGQPIRNPMREIRAIAKLYNCTFYKRDGYFLLVDDFGQYPIDVVSSTELTLVQWDQEFQRLLANSSRSMRSSR